MSDSLLPEQDPSSPAPVCPACKQNMRLLGIAPHSDPARTAKQYHYECAGCGYRYTMTIEQAE